MAILGVGAPTLSLRQANRKAAMVRNRRMPKTITKPSHRPLNAALMLHATLRSPNTIANTPNTAPAATAAAPRAMLVTLVVISTLASSISSRTSTVIRSVTSVTAVAKLSLWLVSGAKALEDHGEQETAGEG